MRQQILYVVLRSTSKGNGQLVNPLPEFENITKEKKIRKKVQLRGKT